MIVWTTKSLFEGYFPCPSYIAERAIKKHQDLYCIYGKKEMIIKELSISGAKVKESLLFDDKSNMNKGKPYTLWYFLWKPKTKNQLDREMLGF